MITVLFNQTLLDIAIQEDGTVLSALEWAIANNICITDKLVPGQQLVSPTIGVKNIDVANYFKNRGQSIATGFPKTSDSVQPYPDPDFNFPSFLPYVF